MIKKLVSDKLQTVILDYFKSKGLDEEIKYSLEIPPKNIDADFALNAAMLAAKILKTNPKIIAQEMSDIIVKEMSDIVEKTAIAGAGFINIYVKNSVLFKEIQEILAQKDKYASISKNNKEKILIEFVSANPTGPLHIGHGRGAAIGDSLARVLKHLGYAVSKEYYLNDCGNQMLVLGKSTKIRYQQLKGEKIDFPSDHYQGDYITDIAKNLVVQNKNIDEINFKEEAVKDILNGIKDDLNNFGVDFDIWFSESDIAVKKDGAGKTEVDKICCDFENKGFAYVQDGALWLKSTQFGDDKDRVLKRSDGRYTYLASDAAYHKNKFERGFAKLINLLGADHHGYVARLKSCAQMLGHSKDALEVILYQLVSLVRGGKPAAMSTRTGEFITLKEVVDEVGKDACRFFFLLRAPDSQLEFDIELAKKQSNENPVFYVQYVSARCNSILRESRKRKNLKNDADLSLLNTKEERDLIKKLCSFYSMLSLCEKSLSPHHITAYLMELADAYHRFYEACRVLIDDAALSSARLKLISAVMIIIKNGLSLAGASAPEQMYK
ncbi:MAG: arginine--tRNA ligase [Elusimicrobiota bacterium]|jgi:arginyl-tRNA synthetase|nr:arginine--tRNA ligase [Elusimicrobiota bacterium]